MGQLAGQRGSFRAGQRGAADGAAGRARSKLDSHHAQPTALSPAHPLRCTATWLRVEATLCLSKTHSKRCASVCSLVSRDRSSTGRATPPGGWGSELCRWPRVHVRAAMPRRGEQGSSVCPCARPGAWYAGGCQWQGKAQVCCPSDWGSQGSEDRGSGGEGGTRGAAERLGGADHHRRPEDEGGGHGG